MHQRLLLLLFLLAQGLTASAFSKHSGCSRPNATEIVYRGDGEDLPKIYSDLVHCPNITSLDLDLTWTGCVPPESPWAFKFRPGNEFVNLKKLSLSNYDFNDSWKRNVFSISHWNWTTYIRWNIKYFLSWAMGDGTSWYNFVPENDAPENGSNLEKWLQAMDFSGLEELYLAQSEKIFYTRMKQELPGLKRLSIDMGNSGPQLPAERIEFIRSVPALDTLSIFIGAPWGYEEVKNRTQYPLEDILEIHGRSLHSLELKQREGHDASLRRPMLTISEINAIRESCPNLGHLGLDIDRNGSTGWPEAAFDAIKKIESLESLTIRLELGADLHAHDDGIRYSRPWADQSEVQFREPMIDLDVAEHLFKKLTANKNGKAIKKVDFVLGDFEDKPYWGPIYLPPWEEGRTK